MFFFIITLSMIFIGCGKKVEKDDGPDDIPVRDGRGIDPTDDEAAAAFIAKQEVICPDGLRCNPTVAKLVVLDRKGVKFCTATLLRNNIIVTSSSCLTRALRVPGNACRNKVFAIFPKTRYAKKSIHRCASIVKTNNNLQSEVALIRGDFAFIKLSSTPRRGTRSYVSRLGFIDKKNYSSWRVDITDDYNAVLRKDKCKAVYHSFANPFSVKRDSPQMIMGNCSFKKGNTGAGIFDSSDNLRGILGVALNSTITRSLENSGRIHEPVSSLEHVSNFSCVKNPASYYEHPLSEECRKELRERELISLRKEMFDNSFTEHVESMEEVKRELKSSAKYFKWNYKFHLKPSGEGIETHIFKADCIHNIDSWIAKFRNGRKITKKTTQFLELPNYTVTMKLNKFLQKSSVIYRTVDKKYRVTFSPSRSYFDKSTYARIDSELFNQPVYRYDRQLKHCK